MKDSKNHLRHVQKKIIQANRKENKEYKEDLGRLEFKRPKNLLNKRKFL